MQRQLILLGGPPGVGKTSTVKQLLPYHEHSGHICVDSLWQIHPFAVNHQSKRLVEANLESCIQNYEQFGLQVLFITWIFHRKDLVERVISMVSEPVACWFFPLVCSPQILETRQQQDQQKPRELNKALTRQEQIQKLPYTTLDTSRCSTKEVVKQIQRELHSQKSEFFLGHFQKGRRI